MPRITDLPNPGAEFTSRQLVNEAISHRPTGRLPLGEICIDDELVRNCFGRSEVGFGERREYIRILGLDLICLPPPSLPMDALTSGFRYWDGPLWEDLEQWREDSPAFVFVTLNGGFAWSTIAMGFTRFMLAVSRGEGTSRNIFDQAAQMNIQLARQAVHRGAQAVMIADDIACNSGTLVPMSFLESCYFPSLSPFMESMNELRVPVFFHSDGDLMSALPFIAGAGFTGLHCLDEPAGMDLARVKREYGAQLCLWGNLNPAYLVEARDRSEIELEVNRILDAGAAGGGFIFGTSSGLFHEMKQENISWAYQTARRARTGSAFLKNQL